MMLTLIGSYSQQGGPAASPGASQSAGAAAEALMNGARPSGGEAAASATRAETANRVDPATQGAAAQALPGGDNAARDLLPPDPAALPGPTPSFDRSVLEAQLASVKEPAPLVVKDRPAGADAPKSEIETAAETSAAATPEVVPSAATRVEAGVTLIRSLDPAASAALVQTG